MNTTETLHLYSAIKEHYDGGTSYAFMQLAESDRMEVARNLVDQIYTSVADRYNAVDFGSIPKSQGKISNMKEYVNLQKSLELLSNIAKDSKQDIREIAVVSEALSNIVRYSDTFHYGFVKNNPTIIMTYNLLSMSVYCGTSLLISVLVDYINQGTGSEKESVELILNRKYSKSHSFLMIESLAKFNDQVKKGAFKMSMDLAQRQDHVNFVHEGAMTITAIAVASIIALLKIIPVTKELIYIFYHTKVKLSDAFKIQADLIEGNLQVLQNRGVATTSKAYRVQKWFADKLTTLANKFAISYEKGERKAEIEAQSKITPSDVLLF